MANYSLGEARGKIVLETDFSSLAEGQKALDGYKQAADRNATSSQEAWKKTGTAATVGGAAIVAGFGVAVAAASDFEFQMSAIQAVSGATAGEMDLIREAALRIGKDTSFSASEAANAMEELSKAGISTKDILGGAADAVVALAAAGGVDLPTAATIAANAMNQFGIQADGLVNVTDKIAGAANASAIDMGEFAQSMGQVGAVANLAGLSFDDTTLAIAAMGNAGIKGSDAGTSLKTMLMNLQPATADAGALMKELGLITADGANQFYTAEGSLKSMADISTVLGTALAGMTKQQKQATLSALFGSDAVRGAAIVAETGAAGFDKLADAIGKTSAADVAATRLDNMKGSTEALGGSVETLLISIGSKLLPVVTDMVDNITNGVNAFASMDEELQNFILGSVGVIGGILLIVGGTIKMIGAMQSAIAIVKALELAKAAAAAKDIAASVASGIAKAATVAATVATSAAAAAQWALNAALTANPIGLVIAAVVALVAGLVWFFTQTELGQQIWQGFVDFLVTAWTFLQEAATNVWNGIMVAIGAVVDWFQTYVLPIIQFVIDAIVLYFTIWYTIVSTVIAGIMTVIGAIVDWFMTYVAPLIQAFVGLLVAIFMFLFNTAVAIWQGIMDGISGIVNGLIAFVVGAFNLWLSIVTTVLTAVWAFIVSIWTTIVGFLQPIIEGIVRFISDRWNALIGIVSGIFNSVWSTISSIWNSIMGFIQDIVGRVVSTVTDKWNSLIATVAGIFKAVYESVKNPIEDALDIVMGFKDKIIGFFSGAGKWLVSAGKNIIDGLIGGIQDALGGLTDLLGSITNMIPEKKGPPAKDKILLAPAGRLIMQGLINGLQSEQGNLENMLGGLNATIPATLSQEINANIASTSGGKPAVVIQVEWHAAPNDKISTREQVMDMLGHASELVREELS